MPNLYKYRIWCNVESMYYEQWAESTPLVCPNTAAHDIDLSKTSIMESQLEDEKRDTSGKLRVHQTSRPLGTKVHFTSRGDDPSNVNDVGGGISLDFHHTLDDPDGLQHVKYLDFNTIENLTYIHEGYVSWTNCDFDEVTLEVVPRSVTTIPAADTGYFVNPAAPYIVLPAALAGGQSNVDINEDLGNPSTPGLVFMPEAGDPQFGKPAAYWDADWNTSNKRFENIRPMPAGDGKYNIFTMEIVFSRFANHIQLVGDNAIPLKTSDTDKLGHGMRIKFTIDTNVTDDGDHEWHIGCILTMHREKSVAG